MRLEAEQAIDDLHAALLQRARPLDVAGLVEAGLELDDRRHLLAGLGRSRQRLRDRRVPAGAVESLLDRQHVGVVGGAGDELDHGIERVVGVVKEHVFLADDGEDVVDLAHRRRDLGAKGSSRCSRRSSSPTMPRRSVMVERALDTIDVEHRIDVDGAAEALHAGVDPVANPDLDPHGVAAVPAAELGLDRLQEILALFFVDLEVPVAGDAESVGAAQAGRGEELLHVASDEVLGAGRRRGWCPRRGRG